MTIGPSPNVFHKSGIKRAAGTHVDFASTVSVYIGRDDEFAMQCFAVSHDALKLGKKQWGPQVSHCPRMQKVTQIEWTGKQMAPKKSTSRVPLHETYLVQPMIDVQNSAMQLWPLHPIQTEPSHPTATCQYPSIVAQPESPMDHRSAPDKWNHSIVQNHDFVDEWAALDRAYHLAVSVAQDLGTDFAKVVAYPATIATMPASKNRSRQVSFSQSVWTKVVMDDETAVQLVERPLNQDPSQSLCHDASTCPKDIVDKTSHVPHVCATCLHHCDRLTMNLPETLVMNGHREQEICRYRFASPAARPWCLATPSAQFDQPKSAPRPARKFISQSAMPMQSMRRIFQTVLRWKEMIKLHPTRTNLYSLRL